MSTLSGAAAKEPGLKASNNASPSGIAADNQSITPGDTHDAPGSPKSSAQPVEEPNRSAADSGAEGPDGNATIPDSSGSESSPDEGSLQSVFADLEKEAGLIGGVNDSYNQRLAALELKVLGEVKNGSLVERLGHVRAKLVTTRAEEQIEESSKEAQAKPVAKSAIERRILALSNDLPPINTKMPLFFRVEPIEPVKELDYLADILDATQKKVLRFKTMPIPVYITPYPSTSYTRACVEGFESWERRSNGLVRFVQVDSPKLARIRVVWKRLGMSTDSDNCALGAHTVTKWTKHPNGKVTVVPVGSIPVPLYIPRMGPKYTVPAQVIEVNVDLIDAKTPDFRFILLKNIVTHELGHALGILGHSPEKSDLMYTVTDENSRISPRDVKTLFRLYELKVDIPL